ncbi:HAD family hydrolase [Haloarculaceae archaeon H-GB2-1]|nr:HAD family hydrolase [Haloarculaceae archaeon H-GB1-1]MEA5386330.1 HAD family hydrolase [Haloarculaceae archaeon H-GB11]MEA5407832.1 HAD family hydrolase [Haloarculaceae archaeon H-GB2-1]
MALRAVAFDLDYTLAVPNRDRATLLAEAREQVGAPPITREQYLQAHDADLASETRVPIFESLLEGSERTTPERLAEAYRTAVEDALVPVPGAEALLESLRERYRVGVLTDGPVRAQRGKLETLGWTDLFDATVVTGALPAGKPDQRTFSALVRELDVESSEVVYVGDHPTFDVEGAKEAGMRAVQVHGTDRERHEYADAHLDRTELADRLPDVLSRFD